MLSRTFAWACALGTMCFERHVQLGKTAMQLVEDRSIQEAALPTWIHRSKRDAVVLQIDPHQHILPAMRRHLHARKHLVLFDIVHWTDVGAWF